jgi:hypothetical protein
MMLVRQCWMCFCLIISWSFSLYCCTFATTRPTIISKLLQWQESFEWFPLCIPHGFEIPLVFIVMAFTLSDFSRHVKSVHPHVSLVSKANQAILSLQVSSPLVLLPSTIPLISWGWLQA